MDVTFELPNNWELISPEDYVYFGINSSEVTPCMSGYLAFDDNYCDHHVVYLSDFGYPDSLFIDDMKKELQKLIEDKTNVELVNNHLDSLDNEFSNIKVSAMLPIYIREGEIHGKKCFAFIMRSRTNYSLTYCLQVFVNVDDKLLVDITTRVKECSKEDPLGYLIKNYPHVKDIFDKVIKTIKCE